MGVLLQTLINLERAVGCCHCLCSPLEVVERFMRDWIMNFEYVIRKLLSKSTLFESAKANRIIVYTCELWRRNEKMVSRMLRNYCSCFGLVTLHGSDIVVCYSSPELLIPDWLNKTWLKMNNSLWHPGRMRVLFRSQGRRKENMSCITLTMLPTLIRSRTTKRYKCRDSEIKSSQILTLAREYQENRLKNKSLQLRHDFKGTVSYFNIFVRTYSLPVLQ